MFTTEITFCEDTGYDDLTEDTMISTGTGTTFRAALEAALDAVDIPAMRASAATLEAAFVDGRTSKEGAAADAAEKHLMTGGWEPDLAGARKWIDDHTYLCVFTYSDDERVDDDAVSRVAMARLG